MKTKERLAYLENLTDHDGEWLAKHDDQIDNLKHNLSVTDMRLTRLSGDVRDAQRTADKAHTNLVGHLVWHIALTLVCTALFLWNAALTIQIDRVNAMTVAHQVLPK